MAKPIPLVLLPGHMCDERLFEPQMDGLNELAEVLFFSLRHGDSMADYASQVLGATPEKFTLVGLSMGGIVAMEILRQAPHRVDRLVLMDTNPLAEPSEVGEFRETLIKRVLTGELETVMREELKPKYLAQTANRSEILDLCMDMALKLGPEVFVRQARALQSRPDQQSALRSVEIPSLIICGAEDDLCPLAHHQLMSGLIKKSTLEVIPGAGHLPTLEQPELTTRILKDWLLLH